MSSNLLLVEAFYLVEELAKLPVVKREEALQHRCAQRPDLRAAVEQLEAAPTEPGLGLPLQSVAEGMLPALANFLEGPDELVGRTLGPYRIEAVLGEGGMGRVYRAAHTGHGGPAAVKLLRPGRGETGERVARLRREAHLLARCRHPGIVQIHHTETAPNGETYFGMELVEGLPITEHCLARGLGLKARLELWGKICEAVGAAHEVGVIHRDLKPTNVLAREDGGVKLLDFGVAEAFGEGDLSCRGYMSGPYSAPEQLEETTKRTDVYSLGVILGELLIGRLPFVCLGESVMRVSMAELAGPASAWKSAGQLRRAELESIFTRATAEKPQDRYGSVKELAEEVRRLLEGRPVHALQARQPGWKVAYVGVRTLRRHAIQAVVLILFAGLGTTALGSYTQKLRTERDAARRAKHDAEQKQKQQELLASLFVNGDGALNVQMTRALLERAIRKANVIALDPEQRAGILKSFGADFGAIADFERAEGLFKESLAVTQATGAANGDEAADVKLRLADTIDELGHPSAALESAKSVRAELVRRLPAADTRVLRADIVIGGVLNDLGKYKDARSILQNVVSRERGMPELTEDLSDALNNLSISENYLGNLESSIALQQESMALDIANEGAYHPDIGEHWMSIANAYQLLREPEKTVEAAQKAVTILSEALEPGSHDVLAARNQLARGLVLEGRLEQAEEVFRGSLAALKHEEQLTQLQVATRLGLGDVLRKEGRLKESLSMYQEAFGLAQRLFPTPTVIWAICEYGLSVDDLLLGKNAAAEDLVRDSVKLDVSLAGPEKINTLQGRLLLAQVLVAEHRYNEARKEVDGIRDLASGSSTAVEQVLGDAMQLEKTISRAETVKP